MKQFWSLVSNDRFKVGCTGQAVHVWDQEGRELAKFKDLIYAYDCAISPKGDQFVVVTTEGCMAVYSFETCSLIKKFRFLKKDCGSSEHFCFSPDGLAFYSVENHINSLRTILSVYDTRAFTLKKKILGDDPNLVLSSIEYDKPSDTIFLLGYFRDQNSGVATRFFVAKLINDELKDLLYISEKEHQFYRGYKALERRGFTEKAKRWSSLAYHGYDLDTIEQEGHSLKKLWMHYAK
jgi:WD40 repeat protein